MLDAWEMSPIKAAVVGLEVDGCLACALPITMRIGVANLWKRQSLLATEGPGFAKYELNAVGVPENTGRLATELHILPAFIGSTTLLSSGERSKQNIICLILDLNG